MIGASEQLTAHLIQCWQHGIRRWFGVLARRHTIGHADFMSKIFNE
ncbi:MAG: hypothetical protein KF841_15580 [Phycisphaerae bacterium]|nr:hypothetical protein [Phycisphaerae bacterium]